mmetsp:Transcript_27770/g.70111  ORF Transcript_27770/g.70111 Transcript_27770/m.70111 type:complete len:425 (-) Transcript_27770:346-1620(-)
MFQDRVRQLAPDEIEGAARDAAPPSRLFGTGAITSSPSSPSYSSSSYKNPRMNNKQGAAGAGAGLLSSQTGGMPGFEGPPEFRNASAYDDTERDEVVTGRYYREGRGSPGAAEHSPGGRTRDPDKQDAFRSRLQQLEQGLSSPGGRGNDALQTLDQAGVRFGMHPAFREQISNLRGKLIHVGERFVGFDKSMEELAHMRKVAEEARIQSLADDMTKLERALNTEVRRRVDYTRTLQIVTENYANEMLDKLQKKMMRQMEQIIAAFDSLSARCLTLERGMMQFRGELPSKLMVEMDAMMRRTVECKKELALVAESLNGDRSSTSSVQKQVGELEYAIDHNMERFFSDADLAGREMSGEIKNLATRNIKDEEAFQRFVLEELKMVRKGVSLEEKARKKTDDEIVAAINVYTNALQNGLRAANLNRG